MDLISCGRGMFVRNTKHVRDRILFIIPGSMVVVTFANYCIYIGFLLNSAVGGEASGAVFHDPFMIADS